MFRFFLMTDNMRDTFFALKTIFLSIILVIIYLNAVRFNFSLLTTSILSVFFKNVAQMVKNLPTMQETQVRSLGWEDPLEKGMATHSSVLAWRIP